ncbi:MAG TPA: polysaccharide deacetylase family protein [Anaerolineales bacterium]|nr:polysaccharide deacetylase family protein [Anaerolineales bacterium]
MKKASLFVLFTLLAVTACMFVQQQFLPVAVVSSSTPIASATDLVPTATPTALPVFTPSFTPTATLVPSATPHGDIAPTLPHMDVQFIYHGDRSKPYVALTFDLCQKPELPAWFDRGIYDVLTRYDVPATFFMGGDWMRTHVDETLLLASNPKFELGNHSWSHPDLPGLSEEIITKEIVKTQNMLYKLTGRQAKLFRLPSGLYDDLTLSVIAWNGLYTIQWDVETGDPDPTIDAARMNWAVRERVQNGSIIIMHANGRGWHTAEALPEMIEYLQSQGYTLVTVSQLLGLEPIQ